MKGLTKADNVSRNNGMLYKKFETFDSGVSMFLAEFGHRMLDSRKKNWLGELVEIYQGLHVVFDRRWLISSRKSPRL